MKTTNLIVMSLLGGVLALAGCNKPQPPAVPLQQGVAIDVPKLKAAFADASPELRTGVSDASSLIRHGSYSPALAALAKIADDPSLTESQKGILSQVTEQVNQAASKVAAPPAQ